MSKECRSQRKAQVLATTSIDDGVTIEEYASYFDGDDEGQDYEFDYNNDIANDSKGEVWQAFMMKNVNCESDGMPELVDASESDSDDEYDRKLASQRRKKKSLKKPRKKAALISSDDAMPPLASDSSGTDNELIRLLDISRKVAPRQDKTRKQLPCHHLTIKCQC
jgi:hypothetical protein